MTDLKTDQQTDLQTDLKTIYLWSFRCIECIGFLLPAFPEEFQTRLFVLFTYFVAHVLGLPTMYMKMKHETLENILSKDQSQQDHSPVLDNVL